MHHVVPPAMLSQIDPEPSREPCTTTSTASSPTASHGHLRWTVHPAASDPLRAVLLVGVLAIASTLAFEYSGSASLGILAFFLLSLSLRSWFLPRHYSLDATGAHESGPLCANRHLPWTDVRNVAPSRFGIYLSTLHTRSRFVRDAGLFLRTVGIANARSFEVHDEKIDRKSVQSYVDRATAKT
ncbi:MAG: hypothetical protein P8N09_09435 [Planctomycetota bacterium]|jgi:hypothetical protein|nr:hypothetical protein [Planctomycetota bacterium]